MEWPDAEWLSPDLLPASEQVVVDWRARWPPGRGVTNWGAVGRAADEGRSEWLMVEVKAHLAEIGSSCQATAPKRSRRRPHRRSRQSAPATTTTGSGAAIDTPVDLSFSITSRATRSRQGSCSSTSVAIDVPMEAFALRRKRIRNWRLRPRIGNWVSAKATDYPSELTRCSYPFGDVNGHNPKRRPRGRPKLAPPSLPPETQARIAREFPARAVSRSASTMRDTRQPSVKTATYRVATRRKFSFMSMT